MGERVAIVTGSTGPALDAVSTELRAAGLVVRHVRVDPGAADPAPFEIRAEVVVHLGVRTPRDMDEPRRTAIEVSAARTAARLAKVAGARRFLHVSATGVYGQARNLPCRESELKAPRTALERICWRAEQASWAAFRRGAPLTVLRPALVYGPTMGGGVVRSLALVALYNQHKRRVPIIRRGPVAHLVHLADVARAVVHVALHPDDEAVRGRAFNVADEAPLPLAEHLDAALTALGYRPGRVLPSWPRLASGILWLIRNVPDRTLLAAINRQLAGKWERLRARTGVSDLLVPRLEREALYWMSTDHYYDTQRLRALGWRAAHPVATAAFPETVHAMIENGLLPRSGQAAPNT